MRHVSMRASSSSLWLFNVFFVDEWAVSIMCR